MNFKFELRLPYIPAGPRVHGCRPALVTFETFKDREDVLKNSKVSLELSLDCSQCQCSNV